MAAIIPASHIDLVEGPIYSVFTTVSPSGAPENSVVWCSWDGTHVLVNTVEGRRKARNVKANPQVALCAIDPKDPYRWIDIRGTVEETVEDTDYQNISAHAMLYAGQPEYYGGVAPAHMRGKEKRIIFKIRPDRVVVFPPRF